MKQYALAVFLSCMATQKTQHSQTVSPRITRRRAIGLLVLALAATVYLLPKPMNWLIVKTGSVLGTDWTDKQSNKSFLLGLDLQGGSRLEYEADLSAIPATERQEAVNGVRDVIERRVNALGVSEPLVQTTQAGESWRVNVELAGVSNVEEAIKRIGDTPILEFKEENTEAPRELTAEERARITAEQAAARARAEGLLAKVRAPGADFSNEARVATSSTVPAASSWLREGARNLPLYYAVRTEAVGVVQKIIDTPEAYYVVKIDEKKQVTKEAMGRHLLISWQGAERSESTLTKEQAKAKIDELKKQANPQNFEQLVKQHSLEPNASSTGGLIEWIEQTSTDPSAQVLVKEFADPFFALPLQTISDVVETPFGYHLMLKTDERPVEDVRAQVATFDKLTEAEVLPPNDGWKATKLTGKQLESARVDFNQQTGGIQVALQFNGEGTDLFAEITRKNIGKRVGIFIDGELLSAPMVQSEIPGGQAVITGVGTLEEARALARNLQAGALPVPISLIAKQTIGPSLGIESLEASLRAGLAGFLLVALFMVLVYRLPGAVAVASLALYTVLSLAVFKYIPVTLTLAGIAGFILSIGIAVDANVLVFERFKEELRLGKGLSVALEDAFQRAWPSVRDGHMTVLISCAVLYWFSSSVIRGFSLTLAIGIAISLFTAVVTCRIWLRALALTPVARWKWGFLGQTTLDQQK